MIDSQHVLYNKDYKPNDICLTPRYAVTPLLEFIPQGKIIWCPFDTKESEYVKVLGEAGHNVIYSHIDYGQDFMEYEPREPWDILISNAPFTRKRLTFERALSFGKPFAILMSLTWLDDSAPTQIFGEHLQLLMFNKRIKFNNQQQKGITFATAYFCFNFLSKQICVRKLDIPKKGSQ